MAAKCSGQCVKQARLADQIERDVGQRNVFFQRRCVAAPFAQALREDQAGVGQAQDVAEFWVVQI